MLFLSLKDLNPAERRVLVRFDLDVPIEGGKVSDDTRLKAAVPTIEFLLKKKAKVIIIGHMGRPGGKVDEKLRLDVVAKRLSSILKKDFKKVNDCIGPVAEKAVSQMKPGDILMLENLRFYPGEEKNDPSFAASLAKLGDIFVNDSFATSHRAHASVSGIPALLPSAAGLSMEKEISVMAANIDKPKHPFVVIIGGAKLETKIPTINRFLKTADHILVGGAMVFTFYKAMGLEIGNSKYEPSLLSQAKEMLNNSRGKLILPVDVIVAEKFDRSAKAKPSDIMQMPIDWMGLDIGPKTTRLFASVIKKAKLIVWNGPLGVFEWPRFSAGSKAVALFVSRLKAVKIVGGGDTASMISKFGLTSKFTHISTGGGASLEMFEGKKLPGIAALEESYKKNRRR